MKKRRAILARILVLALILSGTPQTVFGLSNIMEQSDPFEMMVDTIPDLMSAEEIIKVTSQTDVALADSAVVNTDIQPSDYEDIEEVKELIEETVKDINAEGTNVKIDQLLLEDVLKQQQDLIEQYKTDRFIVKYKEDSEESFKEKVGDEIQNSIKIESVIPEGFEIIEENDSEGKPIDSVKKFLEDTANNIGFLNRDKDNTELIILENRINPSEFSEKLKNIDAVDDIEYIQPDFQMELSGLVNSSSEEDSELTTLEGGSINIQDSVDENATIDESISEEKANDKAISNKANEDPIIEKKSTEEAISHEETIEMPQTGKVTVAIIDTGLDITHQELKKYIYINPKEIPNNGIDDDSNGYIDDINGWNFPDNSGVVYDESLGLEQAHATHIAGIIAGVSKIDDKQISDENIEILPLKVFSNGTAYTSDIIAAINYAEKMGAKVINCSFGSTDNNPALMEAIKNSEMLFICSAGNARMNLEVKPIYPACFDLDNIISVTSTNADGGLSYFSNYSSNLVDVAAEGRDVDSTLPGDKRGLQSGSSMSAAFVSRASAIVLGTDNTQSTKVLKERLLNTSDKLSNLEGKVADGRQIKIPNAINNLKQTDILQNSPVSDFDVRGYNPTQDELYQLYSSGNVAQVSTGQYHTLVLKKDRTVWSWGANRSGECGNGTFSYSVTLAQVIGLTDVVGVSTGLSHSLAVKSDGTVWSWGYNLSNQLGDGTTNNRATAVQVIGLTGVASVAAGYNYSLAVKSDGTVWAWGSNYYGQLGDGTKVNRTTPVQVNGLTGIVSVTAGDQHCLAVKSDGTVWAWGGNSYGQLGDGTTTSRITPVQVNGLTSAISAVAGDSHSLAIKSDGTVWAWGANYSGQLGNGTMINKTTPVQVNSLTGVVNVAAGPSSFAIKSDGTVWAWGNNSNWQLGDGTTTYRTTPMQINSLTGVISVEGGKNHSAAAKSDGTVWAWGLNNYGQLGDGVAANKITPVTVGGITNVSSVSAGLSHSLAVKSDGTVWAWGFNNRGDLGDGTTISQNTPVQVRGLTNVVSVAAGDNYSLALKSDRTVWSWGFNNNGVLGTGDTISYYTPVKLSDLTDVISIAAGEHSLALKSDGTVWSWGYNLFGELGDGTTTNRTKPVKVSNLTNIVSIAVGRYDSIAAKSDGTVWSWGSKCGNIPVQVSGLTNVVKVAAGDSHFIAMKSDGTVWAWGSNSYGELGDGTKIWNPDPVKVKGLTGVVSVFAGSNYNLAVKSDGTVWGWGYNCGGELGDNTTIDKTPPIKLSYLTNVANVDAGYHHSIAVKSDGNIVAWGVDDYGQLGQLRRLQATVPIQCQTYVGMLRYESTNYTATIPKSGSNTTTICAIGIDPYGNELPASVISYSLPYIYPGVSINSSTGAVTIAPDAQIGSIQLMATYQTLTCSATLNLIDASESKSINFSTTAGKTYDIPVNVSKISSTAGKSFTITYDTAVLEPIDLCAFTYSKETAAGAITGTAITIESISNDSIVMTTNMSIPDDKEWNGVINVIKFRAKTTGRTNVSVI